MRGRVHASFLLKKLLSMQSYCTEYYENRSLGNMVVRCGLWSGFNPLKAEFVILYKSVRTSQKTLYYYYYYYYLLLLWLYSPLLGLRRFFGFLILYRVGRTPLKGDQPVARPLPTHRTTQTRNKRKQYRHPCLELGSNPRSQRSSEWRHFVP
jgi:hypothetical protein